jgi:hypothetical protein
VSKTLPPLNAASQPCQQYAEQQSTVYGHALAILLHQNCDIPITLLVFSGVKGWLQYYYIAAKWPPRT